MRRAGTRHRAWWVAVNLVAAALVAPVVLAAGFILAVEGVATGRVFRLLALLDRLLPADPALGFLVLALGTLAGLGAMLLACVRWRWALPVLLVVLGGLAEFRVLGAAGWAESGDMLIPAFGAAGVALGCWQLRRALRGVVPAASARA